MSRTIAEQAQKARIAEELLEEIRDNLLEMTRTETNSLRKGLLVHAWGFIDATTGLASTCRSVLEAICEE